MAATQIDIDDEALADAMRLSGARTKKETVNLALREYAERRRRTEARLRHFRNAADWDEGASLGPQADAKGAA
ncbi:type II toxin-antitoxin system VapB family antitoxin [Streptomyces sp. N2-109]|uniref:Type II toxin-antitoxin system VapB family antitoxin n=1 Tax=Streptomyces gossypii TaxID=2883101 RepID=A0ABT2JRF1_9ACTN|nr:type II toxin-antitoxin system VapB family antitoxin [Streptomyces gossypii]MCT2590474.1 type II toxin-antitoxin system VapB family antitoxin [Streptomyces gossypii]